MARRGIEGLIYYPRSQEFSRGGLRVCLTTRRAFDLAAIACMAAPEPVAWEDLFRRNWGHVADGGPLDWHGSLNVAAGTASKCLAILGVHLRARRHIYHGHRLGGIAAFDLLAPSDRDGAAVGSFTSRLNSGEASGFPLAGTGRQTVLQKPQHHGAANASDAPQSLCFPVVPVVSGFHEPEHEGPTWKILSVNRVKLSPLSEATS